MGGPLNLVDTFTYLRSNVSSTENDINTRLAKAWTTINWLPAIWKSDLTDKTKCIFFNAAVISILQYGCNTWTLTNCMEKNYTGVLRTLLNKSWEQHPTKQQLHCYKSPITKTIQVRWIRHARHCWRNKEELISNVLLWTSSHRRAKIERSARTYRHQLCVDTGCSMKDLTGATDDRDGWREDLGSVTWWWW